VRTTRSDPFAGKVVGGVVARAELRAVPVVAVCGVGAKGARVG
jgi:glycerate kinase